MITVEDAAEELLGRRHSRSSLHDYILYTKPDYIASWFSHKVCEALDKFIVDMQDGKRPILVLQAPPQSGKSQIISRQLPAYLLGRFPAWRIGAASYSDELANTMAQDVRRTLASPEHQRLFPATLTRDKFAISRIGEFTAPGGTGSYLSVGIGSGLTGRPLDCVVKGTLIDTTLGKIPVEELNINQSSCRILTYREGELVYEKLKAIAIRSSVGIYRITTESRRVLEVTGDHPIFTGDRYVAASQLAPGSILMCSVPADEKVGFAERWKAVRTMCKVASIECSSYRRKSDQQHIAESDNSLQALSSQSPSRDGWAFEEDRVARIEVSRQSSITYDLQIERTPNFFANGILVHNCGIIDDPTKDAQAALSETIKESQWNWYQSVFTTRLSERSGQVVMATSWAQDDLVGRILAQYRGDRRLTHLRFPAINSEGETGYDPTLPEGPLCPEFRSLSFYLEQKSLSSAYWWAALYQQTPQALGGNVFKTGGLRFYAPKDLPEKFDKVIHSWDCTFKDSDGTDFVVGQVWGKLGANAYLLDQVRARMSFSVTTRQVIELRQKWPQTSEILIEDKANGPAVIDVLKSQVPGILAIEPDGSKLARAHAVTWIWEAGNVMLPYEQITPWMREFISEVTMFDAAAHDDQVDAMTQALRRLFPLYGRLKIAQSVIDKAMGRM
ncbi:MAG: phage terminase large subunit [Sulfobacillus sp.]